VDRPCGIDGFVLARTRDRIGAHPGADLRLDIRHHGQAAAEDLGIHDRGREHPFPEREQGLITTDPSTNALLQHRRAFVAVDRWLRDVFAEVAGRLGDGVCRLRTSSRAGLPVR
jgi:hypothetical protein